MSAEQEPGGETEPAVDPPQRGGLGRAVEAGMQGEAISAEGLLESLGGWRGVVEALLPATVYLVAYIITRDARASAVAPLAIALLAFGWRIVRKEPVQSALSGLLGVGVCVGVTLFTGRGEDFFLPGFWINGAWLLAHALSLVIGWPLIGLLLGFLRGEVTAWRRSVVLRRAAALCTVVWIMLFGARLLVQVPLYFAAQEGQAAATEALGIARLFMGLPLFALAVAITWLVLSRANKAADVAEATKQASPSSDD